ncbi:septal ring lytic transglycosylase RlpA family protein [Candidatus Peregrinibacteria bacterium]|nr:septal ring lytic transglycosylase RlpA family protein [Candidatus Peregrinibacteria bacterium]
MLKRYPVAFLAPDNAAQTVTEGELEILVRSLDEVLAKEAHEVSMYGEKFHGRGTAFGERFDMNALTAAHRTLPHNTLVKVTNIRNGKSVIVRINDRGPYVEGRDMDLSIAAFIAIEDRSKGILRATFQRLGDAALVDMCGDKDPRRAVRITKGVHLIGGVPATLPLGKDLTFRSTRPFVLRYVRYPDGAVTFLEDWILPGESHPFMPGVAGEYTFALGSAGGRARELKMRAIECSE